MRMTPRKQSITLDDITSKYKAINAIGDMVPRQPSINHILPKNTGSSSAQEAAANA